MALFPVLPAVPLGTPTARCRTLTFLGNTTAPEHGSGTRLAAQPKAARAVSLLLKPALSGHRGSWKSLAPGKRHSFREKPTARIKRGHYSSACTSTVTSAVSISKSRLQHQKTALTPASELHTMTQTRREPTYILQKLQSNFKKFRFS